MARDRKTRASVKQSESEAEAEMMGQIYRETIRTFVFDALSDEGIVRKFSEIMSPKFDQVTEKLDDALKYIDHLKHQDKDTKISQLQKDVSSLESRVDDLEQWGRRGSMRIQGIPESESEEVGHKVLALVNGQLKCPLRSSLRT